MKTLTKAEQKKIIKAVNLINEALLLLNNVDQSNSEFRYDGNRNALFSRLDGAKDIVYDIANGIKPI
jgi:hypothetical protein